jgi:hypothetical protein
MKTVSIGFTRDDGDFALFATLNNLDEYFNSYDFKELIHAIASELQAATKMKVEILEREDAPSYVVLDDEDYDEFGVNLKNTFNTQTIRG